MHLHIIHRYLRSEMSSEGRYEIEAAKNRLIAAKTQVSSAKKNVKCAQAMLLDAQKTMDAAKAMMARATKNSEAAQSQLESSKEEMKAAQSGLAEAEKRWEVIDIDDGVPDSPDPEEMRSKKKRKLRKVSQSPSTLERVPHSTAANNLAGAGNERGSSASARPIDRITEQVQVKGCEVQGCGTRELNGVYTRSSSLYNIAPKFFKPGLWNGREATFVIHRQLKLGSFDQFCWAILVCGSQHPPFLYRTRGGDDLDTLLPPAHREDWVICENGVGTSPLPRIKLV